MNDTLSFGTWLKRRRKAAGLTQESLAKQIGCSTVTIKKIESDDLQASVQLAELIAARLDIAPEERAVFVRWARGGSMASLSSLPGDEPWRTPTSTAPPRRISNLPAQLTGMVGREKEIAAACALLRQRGVRLLTLSGPPGIGKTRLGIQIATELIPDFAHGVCFVPLATVSDPVLVSSSIAQALGMREWPGQPLLATMQEYLRDKQLLLLLDNFEQVVRAAPVVKELLTASPEVKVLVTSREVLHLYGEQEFPVPALALPDPHHLPPMEALSLYPAIELFVQRAQAVKPGFALSGENAQPIAEICAWLDGLPLAIEMAAARVKWLSPRALLAHLSQRQALLTGGPRDLSARQQTLRGAIDWSYDLLDPAERRLFARFAVFANSASQYAAQDVLDLESELTPGEDQLTDANRKLEIQQGLRSLADKSLLRVTLAEEDAAEPRFSMLGTIREYARDRLVECGEFERVHHRHLTHYLAWAEAVEPNLHGPDQIAWLDRLEAEHDNLRAALDWARQHGGAAIEAEIRLAGALGWFWRVRGHLTEGLERLRDVLARSQGLASPSLRAKPLSAAGLLAYYQANYTLAYALFEESVSISQASNDRASLAYALHGLGNCCWYQGNQARARSLLEESIALYRELGDPWGTAMSLAGLACVLGYLGDYTATRALFEESLAISDRIGDKWSTAFCLWGLGDVSNAQGDYTGARVLYEKSLPLARELGDKPNIAFVLAKLTGQSMQQGDYPQLKTLCSEALALFREMGDRWQPPFLLRMLGYAALHDGDPLQATALCKESLTLNQELRDERGVIAALVAIGCVSIARAGPAGLRRAVTLFGAAKALLAAREMQLLSPDAASYTRNLALLREQLDPAWYATAWAEGQAMTYEQAIACALEDFAEDSLIPPTG
ncbi:MAG: tetratricopeptide repeat protein [Chloroflexi bacterium]|nr:tetratricopeptide repeat protein [Chloroflexota bacterium]